MKNKKKPRKKEQRGLKESAEKARKAEMRQERKSSAKGAMQTSSEENKDVLQENVAVEEKKRMQGLDFLRAFAIISVTWYHLMPEFAKGAFLGVPLFFVLTGYLLAYQSERARGCGNFRLLSYYKKRILRIYPPLIIVLLTSIGVLHFFLPKTVFAIRPEFLSIVFGYNNWWQIAQNADYFTRLMNASPFTHLWFLGIEMQYYLIWPLIFFFAVLCSKVLGKFAGVGFLALLATLGAVVMPLMYQPEADLTRLYYGTDTRMYAIFMGAAFGLYRALRTEEKTEQTGEARHAVKMILFGILNGMIFAAYFVMDGQNAFTYQGGMLLITVVFCLMLVFLTDEGFPFGKYFENKAFRWLSKHSYGFFLWQYPVIYLFQHWGMNSYFHRFEAVFLIVILTLWSDAFCRAIAHFRMPDLSSYAILAKTMVFVAFMGPTLVFMGYGAHGIAASADRKPDMSSVAEDLKSKSKVLEAQNAKAMEEAKAAREAKEVSDRMQRAENLLRQQPIVCIGDSVMLGSSAQLRKVLPTSYIDAKVSRYVGGGIPIAQQLTDQGRIGDIVLIGLGTNGPIAGDSRYEEHTKALLSILGTKRHIFWVNVYCPELSWQKTNNEYLKKLAAEHKNVTVIDWYSTVAKHPEWLAVDGVHPNEQGTIQYAKVVHETMRKTLAEELKNQ